MQQIGNYHNKHLLTVVFRVLHKEKYFDTRNESLGTRSVSKHFQVSKTQQTMAKAIVYCF